MQLTNSIFSSEIKWPCHESCRLPSSSVQVKNEWNFNSTNPLSTVTISAKFQFPAFSNVDLPSHQNARCHITVDLNLVPVQSFPLNVLGASLGITSYYSTNDAAMPSNLQLIEGSFILTYYSCPIYITLAVLTVAA